MLHKNVEEYMNEEKEFVKLLKDQLVSEFRTQDKKGIYGLVQIMMAYNSNRIEGSTLAKEHTASLFETGTLVEKEGFVFRAKDVEEMTGHFKMFNEILKSLDTLLSVELIKRFHYQLKSGVFEDYINGYPVGEFKNRANRVADITTELPENVPARMAELVEQYNASEKGLLDIAKFHAEYENIHPFQDGNGRTGRAIIFKQCLDSDLIPVIIKDNMKSSYMIALNKAQKNNIYEPLIELFRFCQKNFYNESKPFLLTERKSKTFGEILSFLQNQSGLSDESFADILHISVDEFISLKEDETSPSAKIAEIISERFNVNAEILDQFVINDEYTR